MMMAYISILIWQHDDIKIDFSILRFLFTLFWHFGRMMLNFSAVFSFLFATLSLSMFENFFFPFHLTTCFISFKQVIVTTI